MYPRLMYCTPAVSALRVQQLYSSETPVLPTEVLGSDAGVNNMINEDPQLMITNTFII